MKNPYILLDRATFQRIEQACYVLIVVCVIAFLSVLGFTCEQKHRLDLLTRRCVYLEARIADLEEARIQPIKYVAKHQVKTSRKVTVTTYQSKPRQTDSTPDLNALNQKIGPGQCAVSRDLLRAGWSFGKRVYIEGLGVYTITDIMHKRWSDRIDIWTGDNDRQDKHENVLAVLVTEAKI